MRLVNLTSHPAQDLVLLDRDGDEWLLVIAKVTAELVSGGAAAEQLPVELADRHDARNVLVTPSDVALERTGTSVLCSGPIMAESASVMVGSWSRSVRAFGERRWEPDGSGWRAIPVSAFVPVEPRFENAYGGSCGAERYERNPIGRGYWTSGSSLSPTDVLLPLIEDANDPLTSPEKQVSPLALSPVPRSWSPRRERAGTYDAVWQNERAPLLPEDFDPRAHDVAQDEAIIRPFLRGGEGFELENIGVPGVLRGALPRLLLRVSYGDHLVGPDLDIVRFEPAAGRVALTLRFVCGPLLGRAERAVLRELRMRSRSVA